MTLEWKKLDRDTHVAVGQHGTYRVLRTNGATPRFSLRMPAAIEQQHPDLLDKRFMAMNAKDGVSGAKDLAQKLDEQ